MRPRDTLFFRPFSEGRISRECYPRESTRPVVNHFEGFTPRIAYNHRNGSTLSTGGHTGRMRDANEGRESRVSFGPLLRLESDFFFKCRKFHF
jgi:hypothetical protein